MEPAQGIPHNIGEHFLQTQGFRFRIQRHPLERPNLLRHPLVPPLLRRAIVANVCDSTQPCACDYNCRSQIGSGSGDCVRRSPVPPYVPLSAYGGYTQWQYYITAARSEGSRKPLRRSTSLLRAVCTKAHPGGYNDPSLGGHRTFLTWQRTGAVSAKMLSTRCGICCLRNSSLPPSSKLECSADRSSAWVRFGPTILEKTCYGTADGASELAYCSVRRNRPK